MRYFCWLLFFFAALLPAQVVNKTDSNQLPAVRDTLIIDNGRKDSAKIFRPTIEDYRHRTEFSDFKPFDTSFTVQKYYRFTQYNNTDNFGRIRFANIGAGFQDLFFEYKPAQALSLLPGNKRYRILAAEDIDYYDVKTPTTSFVFHSGVRDGGALKTTYTQNFGSNLNLAVEYSGLRSKGLYQNSLTQNSHFLFSGHYFTKNRSYEAFAHFVSQKIKAEEYGGIADPDLFEENDSRFRNRENLEVLLSGTWSDYTSKRAYLSHTLRPFGANGLGIRHRIYYQGDDYRLNLSADDWKTLSPNATDGLSLESKKFARDFSNTVSAVFEREKFSADAGIRFRNLQLGYRDVELTGAPDAVKKENRIGVVGSLRISPWSEANLRSRLEFSNGEFFGNFLQSRNELGLKIFEDYSLEASLNYQSAAPSFNWLVNSTAVLPGNYNITDFKNENLLEIGGSVGLQWFNSQLFAKFFRVDNLAYWDAELQPRQSSDALTVLQLGADATLDYKKFHLNGRLLFQNHGGAREVYPVPKFIGRGNLYYQTWAFRRAAELMGGIKVYYFTNFDSREYSPLLNEFVMARRGYSVGGRPVVDAYLNMRVKTMQFFIEGQNLTTTFSRNRNYTAPYYPLYDFRVNIGIVWNLFS